MRPSHRPAPDGTPVKALRQLRTRTAGVRLAMKERLALDGHTGPASAPTSPADRPARRSVWVQLTVVVTVFVVIIAAAQTPK